MEYCCCCCNLNEFHSFRHSSLPTMRCLH
jgi:hypothetical protein